MKKRRWLRAVLLLVTLAVLISPLCVWYVVTQPLSGENDSRPAPTVTTDRLVSHVMALSELFPPFDCAHPANSDRAADYVKQEFRRANITVSEQKFVSPNCGVERRNVIASIGPDTEERLIVSAVYDGVQDGQGLANGAPATSTANTASTANTSTSGGVAALIELAQLFNVTPFPIRVELAALSSEGLPTHVASLKERGVRVRAAVVVGSVGNFQDMEGSQQYPFSWLGPLYPKQGDFAMIWGHPFDDALAQRSREAMRASSSLPAYSINLPESYWPEHLPYEIYGYRSLAFGDTGSYRTSAVVPVPQDYERMAQAVQGLYGVVTELTKLLR